MGYAVKGHMAYGDSFSVLRACVLERSGSDEEKNLAFK